MQKVLLSAFACNPTKGSEPGYGWNWAKHLNDQGYEVHCFTRHVGKNDIETMGTIPNLYFHYIKLPYGIEKLYSLSQATMYLYYILWQWFMYKRAKVLHQKVVFNVAHHVSWGSLQLGSFLYKLNIPFIFGPAGGGQKAPKAFQRYFLQHWESELKREKVSNLLQKFNPACRNMVKKAKIVITSNIDTYNLAKKLGAKQPELILDAALPDDFFPAVLPSKKRDKTKLDLLWVGRFLPRKGILLVLDVMAQLKDYSDITITVVGDGETKPEFLSAIERLGLQKSVNWAGKVPYEQVKEFYASHDAFLFTSLRDSCPAQLVEAMAYGLPVITLDLHGQAQIVQANTGIKCAIETVDGAIEELKNAILFFYKDRQKLEEYSKNAYAFARKQTWTSRSSYITSRYY
jgi:glycosyltransferase involved in cell wall biosynthesis